MEDKIKFSVFADLHYKKGMYPSSVSDLERIFERAKDNDSEFVISLGDMCNDYIRSPEIVTAYLKNKQGFDVYGVYGNHELETNGNNMSVVTPLLTNNIPNVIWGTDDGMPSDTNIAYYYFDKKSFRFIFLDVNYSFNTKTGEYEHYSPGSWGAPQQNIHSDSLGKKQMEWLQRAVFSAADEKKHCVIISHPSFSGLWQECDDAQKVREIFRQANLKAEKTVILAINGHLHSNHQAIVEDVVYLDISSVRNGWWTSTPFYPYKETDIKSPLYTFEYTEYNQGGVPAQSFWRPLSTLTMGAQSLFLKDPLSAIITVGSDGSVEVQGMRTEWMYGIKAPTENEEQYLSISDFIK